MMILRLGLITGEINYFSIFLKKRINYFSVVVYDVELLGLKFFEI
jgi:hypothetical protein